MRLFFETESQSWIFLAMVYAGIGIGALYHAGSILRRRYGKIATVIIDIIIFLAAGGIGAVALIVTGQNSLRLYALLGLMTGGIIYSLGIRAVLHGSYLLMDRIIFQKIRNRQNRMAESK